MGGGLMNQDWFWTELSPDGDGIGRFCVGQSAVGSLAET
jgi:hypothetical protein